MASSNGIPDGWDEVPTPSKPASKFKSNGEEVDESHEAMRPGSRKSSGVPEGWEEVSQDSQKYQSPGESDEASTWENAKARFSDPERAKALIGLPSKATDKNLVYGSPPMAIPAESAPALAGVATKLGKSFLGGVGANAAAGAASGAMGGTQKESQTGELDIPGRASKAAVGGLAGGTLAGLLGATTGATKWAGGKLADMTPGEVSKYVANPELAESTYKQFSQEPEEFEPFLQKWLKNVKSALYDQSSAPLRQQKAEALSDKVIKFTPEEASLLPESKTAETAAGEDFRLTGPQAEELRHSYAEKAKFANKLFALGQGAKDPEAANIANMLKTRLEQAAPELKEINPQLARNTRYSKYMDKALSNNPARVLSTGDSIGNTPLRAMRNMLDSLTGSNLNEVSDALEAGKAMNAPLKVQGLIDRILAQPAGRQLIKRSADIENKVNPTAKALLFKALSQQE